MEAIAWAGLPPAHVGLHAGPVLFQEGDYERPDGSISPRIADHAAPHEVLVSQAVVDAAGSASVPFTEVGLVVLQGLGGAVRLFRAGHAG
jgi:adenylate cyclase